MRLSFFKFHNLTDFPHPDPKAWDLACVKIAKEALKLLIGRIILMSG